MAEFIVYGVLVGMFAIFMWGLGRFISTSNEDLKKHIEELKKRGRL